jgi:hypothetical protein
MQITENQILFITNTQPGRIAPGFFIIFTGFSRLTNILNLLIYQHNLYITTDSQPSAQRL